MEKWLGDEGRMLEEVACVHVVSVYSGNGAQAMRSDLPSVWAQWITCGWQADSTYHLQMSTNAKFILPAPSQGGRMEVRDIV